MRCKLLLTLAACLALAVTNRSRLFAEESTSDLIVRPQPATGVYEVGQPIVWQIEWTVNEPPREVRYVVEKGGRTEIARGLLTLPAGRAELKASLDAPGTLIAKFTATAADGEEHEALGGALAAASEVKSSAPRPDDFDAFWDAKIATLTSIPFNAQLEKVDSGREDVDYWKITLDGINGTKIRGQLAKPATSKLKEGEKLPALFIPQWAGVYPLEKGWVTDRASQGWLVLNISAHDLPIDEPAEFYAQQAAGPLRDYWTIGNDDRNASYFLRMYLSCYQAVEYLTQRSDWNGKTLVVAGASQGGQQTFVTAALHPKVTAAMAMVPAGCDMLGPDIGRSPGWPKWYDCTQGKDAAKVRETGRYYDVVNFAPRIKCPLLVGFGLIDETCPPEGIMAAVNQVAAPKETVVLPLGQHLEIDGSHQAYYKLLNDAWLPALRDGKLVPPSKQSVK